MTHETETRVGALVASATVVENDQFAPPGTPGDNATGTTMSATPPPLEPLVVETVHSTYATIEVSSLRTRPLPLMV